MSAIRKILVPVDFSECSRAALERAVELARELRAEIHLMHAWQPPYEVGPFLAQVPVLGPTGRRTSLAELARRESGHALEKLTAELADAGVVVTGRLEPGSAREAIVHAATGGGYDLVVMGTHGRTGLRHLLLGSVAEWVVRHSAVPVLTVRQSREAPARQDERETEARP
jgi:nucleotide-binding universal stress UspA family protein